MTVVPSWSAAAIRAFSVTVSPRSVSTIARCGTTVGFTCAWYIPSVALTSSPNGRSADMCGSTVRVPRLQPPAYGSSKTSARCSSGTEEHDHRAGPPGRGLVDVGQVELGGRDDLEVVVVEPAGLHAEAAQHLEEPVDLLDAGDVPQGGAAPVEQGGAQQRDPGVLRRLDRDGPREPGRAGHPQVRRTGTERDDLGVERGADAGEHLQGEVLVPALDAVDRALAGAERLGELLLGQAAVLARVADEVPDPALVVLRHGNHGISDMR